METKDNKKAEKVNTKKKWDTPQIMELDFSETRNVAPKNPGSTDGCPGTKTIDPACSSS